MFFLRLTYFGTDILEAELLARVVESLFWGITSGVPVIRPQWEANANGASKFPRERREEQRPLERTGLRSSAVSPRLVS